MYFVGLGRSAGRSGNSAPNAVQNICRRVEGAQRALSGSYNKSKATTAQRALLEPSYQRDTVGPLLKQRFAMIKQKSGRTTPIAQPPAVSQQNGTEREDRSRCG
jgi:hypothetical protein